MKHASCIALMSMLWLTGCGGTPECDEPGPYMEAKRGKRIELLDGMDPLPTDQEMTIPEASPDSPPPPGRCIDSPPTLRTGGGDEENEGE